MTTIAFLEKLANSVHYSAEIESLISAQSDDIQNAFLNNDNTKLKKELSSEERFADNVAVVRVVS